MYIILRSPSLNSKPYGSSETECYSYLDYWTTDMEKAAKFTSKDHALLVVAKIGTGTVIDDAR